MSKIVKYFISFVVLFQFCNRGYGVRTKDKMYEQIYNTTGCYRRLNSTHQIGCSSHQGGSRGVVHYCDTLDDLDFILSNGTAPPYIPILSTKFFNYTVVQKLVKSEQVSGLVLYSTNESLDHFTHDYQCPNPSSSFPDSCTKNKIWNPFGTSLLYTDIPFPVFYLEHEEELTKIKYCFEKFNNFSYNTHPDRSLCSLELDALMYATTNTPTCLRRSNIITNLNQVKFCDPLGDSNIWASLYPLVEGPRNETKPITDVKYIVISARLDTTSMFEKTAGANSPVTGIVTLLSIAKFLKESLSEKDLRKANTNVLFILFNGETYDYIGSQRMLYDMLNGDFPVEGLEENNGILPIIRPENISLFIELSQLGKNREKLYIHYLEEISEVSNFYSKLINNSNSYPNFQNVTNSLPPASLHTFLNKIRTFPGLIISDHQKSYTNHYYNSIYDVATNIDFVYSNVTTDNFVVIPKDSLQKFISNLTEIIGKSVYETVTGYKLAKKTTVDDLLVNELFFCYLEDPNCKILSATQIRKLPNMPLSLYVGIDRVASYSTFFTALALGWFVGDIVGEGDISCTNKPRNYAFEYYNMSKSIYELNVTKCYKVTMNTTEAKSPAFIIPVSDTSYQSVKPSVEKPLCQGKRDFDLAQLLEESIVGRAIKSIYNVQKQLDSRCQSHLAETIIQHFVNAQPFRRLENSDFEKLSHNIADVFPNELPGVYYIAPIRKRNSRRNKSIVSRGKLVDKYRNKLNFLRKAKSLPSRLFDKADSTDDSSPVTDEEHKDCEDDVTWIKNNQDPWTEVQDNNN